MTAAAMLLMTGGGKGMACTRQERRAHAQKGDHRHHF